MESRDGGSGSSVPVKVIPGVMKFVGIMTFMIAWENDIGPALTGIGRLCFPDARSPMRCKSQHISSLALRNFSLLARPVPQPKPSPGQPWTSPLSAREC